MMLLLDFAVGSVNRSGRKKTHGNHSNNNTDREYLSVSNYATQVAVVNPEGLNVSTAFPLREQNNGTSVT